MNPNPRRTAQDLPLNKGSRLSCSLWGWWYCHPTPQQNGRTWEGLIAAPHASQCCTYHEPLACQGDPAEPVAAQGGWIPALQHKPSSSRCPGSSPHLQTPSQQSLCCSTECSVLFWKAGRGCSIADEAKLVEQWKPSQNSHRAQPFCRDTGSSRHPGT